jgi:TPR repeat protein
MRISEHILSVALFGLGLGLTTAYAFDGTKSPANVAPPMGLGVAPEAGSGLGVGTGPINAFQAFKMGTQALQAGDTKAGLELLNDAARNGDVGAAWKLGHIYAEGADGVKQDDVLAFRYFSGLADSHADEVTGTTQAWFVAKAFVALGSYYIAGIPNSPVTSDAMRAREMFNYAATYFGDPDAQYRLGRMLIDGQGTPKDPKTGVRWLSLAASKGQYQAQAVFGALLFKGQYVARDAALGLMWLTLAKDAATPKESWITDLHAAAVKQATETEKNVALVHLQHWMDSRNGRRP